MSKREYSLGQVMGNEYRDWALYTVESRAIPNMIDGMKPVQRFYLYSSLKNSRRDFKKVSAVSGVLSDYGYNHAETSGADAGSAMAATWNNNLCLIEGRGNFGSRLVQATGASRYIYSRVHANFDQHIKDLDLSPTHPDPEHEPPRFYIPVLPLVLANGSKGVATGFASSITPRDPNDLARCCREWIKTGKVKSFPAPKFPEFHGLIISDAEGNFWAKGLYEMKGKTTLIINEITPDYDREKYVALLDKLEDRGDIASYEDQCTNRFKFEIKLKRGIEWTDEKILKTFKLEKSYPENLNVIGPDGKLRQYTDVRDIIKDFCEYRSGILSKRIERRLDDTRNDLQWSENKMAFIELILADQIPFRGTTKKQLVDMLKHPDTGIPNCPQKNAERLLTLQIAGLTKDSVKQLEKEISEQRKDIKYWESATPQVEFTKDLKELV